MDSEIDVFVSYKREERGITDTLIDALTTAGFVVVTDLNISKNEEFGDAIDAMIRRARMTIVLWTEAASRSDWVKQEARLARDLSRSVDHDNHYLGVMVENVDLILPADLRGLQMVDANRDGLTNTKLSEIVSHVKDTLGLPADSAISEAASVSSAISDEFQLFEYARTLDVTPAYKKYLDAHPNGEFADIALDLIVKHTSEAEAVAFARACEIDTRSSYQQFLNDFEGGTHDEDAKRRLRQFVHWYFYPLRRGHREYFVAAVGLLAAIFFGVMQLTSDETTDTDFRDLQEELRLAQEKADNLALQESTLIDRLTTAEAEIQQKATQISELEGSLAEAVAMLPNGTLLCEPRFNVPTVRVLGTCVQANVSSLTLEDEDFSDLSDLRKLDRLQKLFLNRGGDVDLETVAELALTHLSIRNTNTMDISALGDMDTLQSLNIAPSDITDLSPLASLPNLTFLWTATGTQFRNREDVVAAIERSMSR